MGVWKICCVVMLLTAVAAKGAQPAPHLQQQLRREDPALLARAAREQGDARRGAIVFFRPELGCAKCHVADGEVAPLGPDLARPDEKISGVQLVESILHPSKAIRKGFKPVVIVTAEGKTITGLLVADGRKELVLRDAARDGKAITVAKASIEQRSDSTTSMMPDGLANLLSSRGQFLDLVRYLVEITETGPPRAAELRPAASLYAAPPVPEYEKTIDHAGFIADWDRASFKRGEAIYTRLCVNCHGTKERAGSLPTSLRFAQGAFKNGCDPYSMYQTLTRGSGMMVAQSWMVPQQKYDVIHYIREAYLKQFNPTQYSRVDAPYLRGLPKGTGRGPAPTSSEPWAEMNYGPSLIASYEIGHDGSNFAYKGIAVRLDAGPGGVTQGRYWMALDHDTFRIAAGWNGTGFIDFNGIMFNGRHAVHPRIVGQAHFANPAGPGWANPEDGTFEDPRLRGRDGRPYGPLPRKWAHYKGIYHYDDRVVASYTVGATEVLEMPGLETVSATPVFTRTFNLGPRDKEMVLQVAHVPAEGARLQVLQRGTGGTIAVFGRDQADETAKAAALEFDGATGVEVGKPDEFDLTHSDYTIHARIKTRQGGTIFCKTAPGDEWVLGGKALIVRGGRLVCEIGSVGAVTSRHRVNDGLSHDVAVVWQQRDGSVQLFVDGKLDGEGTLKPRHDVQGHAVRIGYGAADFPQPDTYFHGRIAEVLFYQRALEEGEIARLAAGNSGGSGLVARWNFDGVRGPQVADATGNGHRGMVVHARWLLERAGPLVAAVPGLPKTAQWLATHKGDLRLQIPAGGEPLRFVLRLARAGGREGLDPLVAGLAEAEAAMDLRPLTEGGAPRWAERLATAVDIGSDAGPFAVDVFQRPAENPWRCRVRPTGFDFLPGGAAMAVCTWDGDVWLVRGIDRAARGLTWQRIASGLFQPLGLKVVDENIYVACRDQIVILRDLNGDGETDFYENFNNDHQVTEHFHEFAMGLQTDADGNFYYAKSARHALKALVPHHGTLLRVSKDGTRTGIVATGFRAANGVCVNPDGTFIVTDQEGHWNPKNRINWVSEGGFYGNMWGYHDVTDTSDSAMEQPLCWITNSFDRSPAELLWVQSDAWGPLQGSLLNFSYGYGKVYVVPHENVGGQWQGGMCALPIAPLPTGVMRGRFHPVDGQIYTCGMFAWAGNQQQPGGFYRIRYTGKPVYLPIGLEAKQAGMRITFSGPIDAETAAEVRNYAVKTWSLKRTAEYGSKHYGEVGVEVVRAKPSADGRSVFLEIAGMKPTWSMEIRYSLRSSAGMPVEGVIHNTIHRLR